MQDIGHIRGPLAGRRRPRPARLGGYGLSFVHQLCGLVAVRSSPLGAIVRVSMSTR